METKDWRYVPKSYYNYMHGKALPIAKTIAHPPNMHPVNSPIRKDMTCLQLIDVAGMSHWLGVDGAMINSELRMIAYGGCINSRNELTRNWKPAKHVP